MPLTYALIHEENGNFGISFPDFPGCVSGGNSPEEVIRKGTEALNFHVASMVEDGDPIPAVRALRDLRADADFIEASEDAAIALVTFDLPSKAVRINVSIDENLLTSIDAAAKAAGTTRSAFLAEAARTRIRAA